MREGEHMKKVTLSEITNGKYSVENGCTYSNGKKEICRFWIKNLCINRCMGREHEIEISFTVTLKNNKNHDETATFPIVYLYEPYGWLHMGFDTEDFCTELKKDEFDFHINKILRVIRKKACSTDEYTIGWVLEPEYSKETNQAFNSYSFNKYDNPDEDVGTYDTRYINSHTLDEYIRFTDKKASVPLICYTLLSVINSLLSEKIQHVPDFIFSITGADIQTRTEMALFYTNLYRRNFSFNMRDYRYTHIMPDDNLSDVYFKMMQYKDSVLISFEPSKRRMNQFDKMFNANNFDADKPIYSLCLITADKKDDIPFKTFNIELPHDVNLRMAIDDNFTDINIYGYKHYKNDHFMDCIYGYINKLLQCLRKKTIDIEDEFITFQSELKANSKYQEFPDIAAAAVMYLCFAYRLYAKIVKPEISYEEVESIIFDTAFIAFPQKDVIASNDYDAANEICDVIDNYFLNHKKTMNEIGAETSGNTKLWFDKQYFYITKDDIQEILTLQKCNINFSPKIRKTLANKGILKIRQRRNKVSKNNTIEYGLHITRPLYGTYYSKVRYYTFSIAECKKNNVFPKIVEIVDYHFYIQPLIKASNEMQL